MTRFCTEKCDFLGGKNISPPQGISDKKTVRVRRVKSCDLFLAGLYNFFTYEKGFNYDCLFLQIHPLIYHPDCRTQKSQEGPTVCINSGSSMDINRL